MMQMKRAPLGALINPPRLRGHYIFFDVRIRWIHQRDPHRAESSTYLQPPLRGVASTTKHVSNVSAVRKWRVNYG